MDEAAFFDEQIAELLLGDDFPDPLSADSYTFYPECDISYDLVDQFITPPYYNSGSNNDDNNSNDNESVKTLVSSGVVQEDGRSKKRNKETEKQAVREGKSRKKRDPNQVQEHIVAERKRRESLSHMFISLAALIPDLKKMDKITILGCAIKQMKQLQEKVKELEAAAAQHTIKSMMMNKKYILPMNDDNDDDDNDDNDDDDDNCYSLILGNDINRHSGGSGASGGGKAGNKNNADYLSKTSHKKIEVKIFDNTLTLKICCENRKSILSKLMTVVDRHDLVVTYCAVVAIQNLTLDITIVAQMEEGINFNAKGLVRTLRSIL